MNDKIIGYFVCIFIVGVRRSKIYCQNKETKRIAHVSLCDDLLSEHLDAHTRIKFCNTPPCPYK